MDPSDYGFRFNRGIPPRALMLDLAETDSNRLRKQSRLTLTCGDVPTFLIKVLRKRGAEVHCVSTVERALAACQSTTYDVLIFDPSARDFAAFVRLMKHEEPLVTFSWPPAVITRGLPEKMPTLLSFRDVAGVASPGDSPPEERPVYLTPEAARIREWFRELGEERVADLRHRYEYVPLFVIKPSSPDEYSVLIRPPGGAYVEKTSKVPLEMAVLRLDARAMFTAMGPLA